MRLLVTGAAGFIGGAFVTEAKRRGHDIMTMDKAWGSSTALHPETVLDHVGYSRCDVIVHLGASCSSQLSVREPHVDFKDNVIGTFNVCEAARRTGVPVVFNSTMKVVPGRDGKLTPYGASKQFGERYLRMYQELYGVKCVINRPSSVYGPGQRGSEDGGWVTHFMRSALRCEPFNLWAPLSNSRDVLFIDDHVDLLLDQVENIDLYATGRVYPCGGGVKNELSIGELLQWLSEHLGTVMVNEAPPVPGDVPRVVNTNEYVSAVNGWEPKVHWTEGLMMTLEWMKSDA